jgi:hypothetical protein
MFYQKPLGLHSHKSWRQKRVRLSREKAVQPYCILAVLELRDYDLPLMSFLELLLQLYRFEKVLVFRQKDAFVL